MSDFADQMTEADEFITFEEGRLQGLREALRTAMRTVSLQPQNRMETTLREAIEATKKLIKEMRGDDDE